MDDTCVWVTLGIKGGGHRGPRGAVANEFSLWFAFMVVHVALELNKRN